MHECRIEVAATHDGHHAITLDQECWQCEGTGSVDGKPCDICDGTGYILTGEGDELLAFFNRHAGHRSKD